MTFQKIIHAGDRHYLYERESLWDPVAKRSKQRNVRYLGKCDAKGRLLAPPAPRMEPPHSAFPIGPLSIFYAAAESIDLTRRIEKALDVDAPTASHAVALTLNRLTGHRPLEKLPAWLSRTPLPDWLDLDPDATTRESFERTLHALCHTTPEGAVEDRGLALQHALTKAWRADAREAAEYYYDITRQVYYGTHCDLAEPGYHPGGTNKRVLGFGLVTSKNHHHPVLCRAIPGSRNDTVTVQDTIHTLQAFDLKHLTLILDRGMVSAPNVKTIVRAGYDQLGIVPETHTTAWNYITRLPRDQVEHHRFVVERDSKKIVYARAWTAPLLGRSRMRVAIVVDPFRKVDDQVTRDALVHASGHVHDATRLKRIREDLGTLAQPSRGRRGWTVEPGAVIEDRKADGRFLMFATDPSMSAEEMVLAYYRRESVERAFRCIKGELTLGPIRYRRRERIDAYTTIAYMAHLLWTLAERRLKEKMRDLSLAQALEIAENVMLVRFGAGKSSREWVTRLTTAQEKVLCATGAIKFLPVA